MKGLIYATVEEKVKLIYRTHLINLPLFIGNSEKMYYSYFVTAIALVASIFNADAIPNKKLSTMKEVGKKDCPLFSGVKVAYTVVRDAESINLNTYIFDGTLFHTDGAFAGFVSIGCQRSPYLSNIYLLGAGVCTFEVQLIENNDFLAIVTAAGTTIFGFANPGSSVAITGGEVCALGALGHIDMVSDSLTIYFE